MKWLFANAVAMGAIISWLLHRPVLPVGELR